MRSDLRSSLVTKYRISLIVRATGFYRLQTRRRNRVTAVNSEILGNVLRRDYSCERRPVTRRDREFRAQFRVLRAQLRVFTTGSETALHKLFVDCVVPVLFDDFFCPLEVHNNGGCGVYIVGSSFFANIHKIRVLFVDSSNTPAIADSVRPATNCDAVVANSLPAHARIAASLWVHDVMVGGDFAL